MAHNQLKKGHMFLLLKSVKPCPVPPVPRPLRIPLNTRKVSVSRDYDLIVRLVQHLYTQTDHPSRRTTRASPSEQTHYADVLCTRSYKDELSDELSQVRPDGANEWCLKMFLSIFI